MRRSQGTLTKDVYVTKHSGLNGAHCASYNIGLILTLNVIVNE